MPSTYTLNNGIELIGTGEQSGTWGDTTNTNFELVDTALDGQVTITLAAAGTSGSPNDLPVSDGTASNGRNRLIIFNDGGDLGATAYVQLTPNDAEKIIYVRNDLSGSRSIILFQGTYNASNDYEVPAGTTAVIYFDGAGTGAVAANVFNNAYFDSLRLGDVSVSAILDEDDMASDSATALATQQSIKAYVDTQVGANNELSEVLANGNTSGGTNIQMSTTDELQFRDTAIKISSSTDGKMDIDADLEVEIVAPTVDIDASTAMTIDTASLEITGAVDMNTSLNVDGDITSDGLTVDGDATFGDNNKAIFGTGSDLQIYHDGSNSVIHDSGTGDLTIRGTNLKLQPAAGTEDFLTATTNAEVTLYHNNNPKLATTSTGVDVTGTVTADGLTVDGNGSLLTLDNGSNPATISNTNGNVTLDFDTTNAGRTYTILANSLNVFKAFNGGDISFYEDTGTIAKFFWDASAESLGIGLSAPTEKFHIAQNTASTAVTAKVENNSATSGANAVLNLDTVGNSFSIINYPDADTGNANRTDFYSNAGGSYFTFSPSNSEAARIDSSGRLLVGQTTANSTAVGVSLRPSGEVVATQEDGGAASLNRNGTDGLVINVKKNGGSVGVIGASGGRIYFARAGDCGIKIGSSGVNPTDGDGVNADNLYDLGSSSVRWDDIYATNGTIQTSDRNEKQDIAELDEAEKRVAIAAKGLIRKYRWKDAVAEKGDAARIHVGIIAQDLQDAFAAEGLDAHDYAMFISATWWEADEVIPAVEEVLDDEGNVVTVAQPERTITQTYETAEEAPEGAVEKTRLGVRYPELLAFIIGAL